MFTNKLGKLNIQQAVEMVAVLQCFFFFKHTFSLCSGSSSNKQVRVFSIPTHV